MRRASLLLAVALTASVAAQQPGVHPISGRIFAPVMGWQGAGWLERPERLEEEEPDTALDVLKIKSGSVVADIGAGSGYMTMRLAKRVGDTGTVYATDIQPQMLQLLQRRLQTARVTNVALIQGTIDDPRLPENALDLELLVDVYHEFSQPQAMLRHLKNALKPSGRLVLVEYRKEDPAIPIRYEHKMTVKEAKLEVEAEGFKLSDVNEELPRQHILIFTKP
ncbi:MAG TPA: class I SAM-dependent methyltransferase [Vicinamibacterales bacterium]|nr:class I SAM-dependent methyltransferase [Vicinamibacterales bacterium]